MQRLARETSTPNFCSFRITALSRPRSCLCVATLCRCPRLPLPLCYLYAPVYATTFQGDAWDRKEIVYVQGDISDKDAVLAIVEGAECVWHNAAAVGPYHPTELYTKVKRSAAPTKKKRARSPEV